PPRSRPRPPGPGGPPCAASPPSSSWSSCRWALPPPTPSRTSRGRSTAGSPSWRKTTWPGRKSGSAPSATTPPSPSGPLSEGKKQGYAVDEKALADLTDWAVAKDVPARTATKQEPIDLNEAPLLLALGVEAGDAKGTQGGPKKLPAPLPHP